MTKRISRSHSLDALQGGSVRRLAKYRRNLARSLETIRAHRTPEAAEQFIKNRGYTSPLTHRYDWMGATGADTLAQLQRDREEKRGYISAEWSLVDGWRDAGNVSDIFPHSRAYIGNYLSDDTDGVYSGHVWQLPARDGRDCYVYGYIEREGLHGDGRQGGYVVLATDGNGRLEMFADKEEAARAADGLAAQAAERDYEYSQRWREAQQADSERDEARKELKEAREFARLTVAALRELPPLDAAHVDAFSVTRARLRESLHGFLDDMRAAIEKIETCRDKIADLDMTGEF